VDNKVAIFVAKSAIIQAWLQKSGADLKKLYIDQRVGYLIHKCFVLLTAHKEKDERGNAIFLASKQRRRRKECLLIYFLWAQKLKLRTQG